MEKAKGVTAMIHMRIITKIDSVYLNASLPQPSAPF